jgi:NADPH-dependent 2,4-dienoyl-CoA reductase/sulfur reductase-like enzyme/nitrite reductase/ring-hydroxylating ferredoxin subunit
MTSHDEALAGPDLTKGVELSSVRPGQLLAGHAFGEAVLLARVDENWFAVGARCTHYSAPLADGLLVGETIRCPWHHACFSLRNGAAVAAPALNDLPAYDVRVENNIVRVTGKRTAPWLNETRHGPRGSRAPERVVFEDDPSAGPRSVVIIGAGAAGIACAEMLRREGYRGPVILLDPDSDAAYDRPNLSKEYLAGSAPEDWLPLHPQSFYESQHIELLTGVEAREIDVVAKTITASDGRMLDFDRLLIATGGSPIRLRIPGGERIMYLRSLADSRAILQRATANRKAVVIGAGFIGLEVAASLVARDLDVSVVAPDRIPLERVLGPELGALVQSVHEARGVKFHLGRSAQSIGDGAVLLDDGTRVEADLVVAGIGVRPNTAIAEGAGLVMADGIAVNEFLETSALDVFAAGDVARWPDAYSTARLRVEHWVVAQRQGQVVARNMLGHRDRFNDIPFFWSNHYDDLHIQYTGHVERWDETKIDGNLMEMDCAVSFMVDGKRRAIATINRDRQNLEAEVSMERELLLQPPLSLKLEPALNDSSTGAY